MIPLQREVFSDVARGRIRRGRDVRVWHVRVPRHERGLFPR